MQKAAPWGGWPSQAALMRLQWTGGPLKFVEPHTTETRCVGHRRDLLSSDAEGAPFKASVGLSGAVLHPGFLCLRFVLVGVQILETRRGTRPHPLCILAAGGPTKSVKPHATKTRCVGCRRIFCRPCGTGSGIRGASRGLRPGLHSFAALRLRVVWDSSSSAGGAFLDGWTTEACNPPHNGNTLCGAPSDSLSCLRDWFWRVGRFPGLAPRAAFFRRFAAARGLGQFVFCRWSVFGRVARSTL
jgi:hypothetical protein